MAQRTTVFPIALELHQPEQSLSANYYHSPHLVSSLSLLSIIAVEICEQASITCVQIEGCDSSPIFGRRNVLDVLGVILVLLFGILLGIELAPYAVPVGTTALRFA